MTALMDDAALIRSRAMSRMYDRAMWDPLVSEFFGGSDYLNWGLWDRNPPHQAAACDRLIDVLADRLPAGTGRILEAACGKGAGLARLRRRLPRAELTGVNISPSQLARAAVRAPGCDLRLMDATRLTLPARSYDAVLCVEAAFQFRTRSRFFREAYQVLRPGGALILADIVTEPGLRDPMLEPLNDVRPGAYAGLVEGCGFTDVVVEDVTASVVRPHFDAWERFFDTAARQGRIDPARARLIIDGGRNRERHTEAYLIAVARRPPEPHT